MGQSFKTRDVKGSPEKCGILWVVLENLAFHKCGPGKFGISWVVLENLEFHGSWKTWDVMSRPGKSRIS